MHEKELGADIAYWLLMCATQSRSLSSLSRPTTTEAVAHITYHNYQS